jgi:hypothetical protein
MSDLQNMFDDLHPNSFRRMSDESRKKMSEAKKGHTTSNKTSEKISNSLTGRKISKETRKKLALAGMKPIKTPIGIFQSVKQAAIALEVCNYTIRKRVKNKVLGYEFI